jgi:hypothetical protein
MKLNTAKLLTDKNVLYIVLFLGVANLLGFLLLRNFEAIVFFLLVGFLTTYFSKNMIIVLLVAMIATNLYVSTSKTGLFREGLAGKESKESTKEGVALLEKKKKKKGKGKVKGAPSDLDDIMAGKEQSSDVVLIDDEEDIDVAQTMEQAYDNLDSMLGKTGMSAMNDDTDKLIKQQQKLMENLKQMGPLVNNAKDMLGTIKDMGFDITQFTQGKNGDILKSLDFAKMKLPAPATEEEEDKAK